MRKINLLICCASILSIGAFAQGSYVRFNVGYGIPMGSQPLGSNYSSTYNFDNDNYTETEKANNGSYGSGVYVNAGYGMTLKGILGLDFEIGYLIGNENDAFSYSDTFTGTGYTERESYKQNRKTTGFSIAPAITFTAQEGKIVPYTRFGPVIGMYKMKAAWSGEYYENDAGDIFTENIKLEEEYTGGISVGFKGSVGVIFNPASKFQIFSEVNFVSMSFTPKKGKITKYAENGVDYTDDIPSEYKTFDFKDKVTDPESELFFPIGDRVTEKHSLGSLALQVGIRYKLN
jgi:hypothetical protein